MSITDPLEDELLALGSSFALQVLGRVDVARRVLQRIREVYRLDGSSPTPIVTLPEGAVSRFDDVDTGDHFIDVIRRVLDDEDLDGDSLVLHPTDGLADLDDCPRAVVLRLFPPPADRGRPLPPAMIDVAGDWVFGDLDPDADVRMRVLGVEFTVRVADAAGIFHGCAGSGAWCDMVTGDVGDRVRTASVSFGAAPHVAIAAGGPGCDDAGLLARFDLLAGVAPELADLCAYACIDFEESFDQLALGLATSAWSAAGHAPANRVVGEAGDRAVPDAYPFQLLGPAHRQRLAEAGRASVLDDATAEGAVYIGEPDEWLPDRMGRHAMRQSAWEDLAPLLLEVDDLDDVALHVDAHTDVEASGVPDLDHIVIEPGPHARRGTHLSPLELAAWLAGEHHSDEPAAVGPVLSTLLRSLTSGLPPQHRRELASIVPLAIRSGRTEPDRVRDIVEWLVRTQAATWLRRSGVTASSDRLAELADVSSPAEARRAVTLLSAALVTAQRRLDITTAIAGEHAERVEACAWSTWEAAAEASGWAAASDAIGVGVPAELTAEVERRLVDSMRDRAATSDGDAEAAPWDEVQHELASFAWHRAWDSAERRIRDESGFDVRTVIDAHLDDDLAPDVVADDVDRAASAAVTAASRGGELTDAFDAATSAETGRSGQAWRAAMESARHVIGEIVFDDAFEHARRELDHWIDAGPRLLSHTTLTSLAREAAGVGARSIAARAAAECTAAGGSDADCAAAAEQALAPTVDELAAAALDLARQLCGPSDASASTT